VVKTRERGRRPDPEKLECRRARLVASARAVAYRLSRSALQMDRHWTTSPRVRRQDGRLIMSNLESATPAGNIPPEVYSESMSTLRSLLTLAVQVMSALALANVTILGFAFRSNDAALILLGALTMAIASVMHISIRKWMQPFVAAAVLHESAATTAGLSPVLAFSKSVLGSGRSAHPTNRRARAMYHRY
jgi:hypothetical protein